MGSLTLFQALILGIVQGATEYIPVSSSAHLILVPWFFGWPEPSFAFDVLVQWGTLVGVIIFFWTDIWDIINAVIRGLLSGHPLGTFDAKLGWLVVVATIPAVIIGLLVKDYLEQVFQEPVFAGGFLMITAVMLVVAENYSSHDRDLENLDWGDALAIGLWQVVAMLPGVSRSGSTISGAVMRDFSRTAAARFSFLMSIPVIFGAGLLTIKDLIQAGTLGVELPAIMIGFVAAAISGYLCIRWLLKYLQSHSLYVFAAYCVLVSCAAMIKSL